MNAPKLESILLGCVLVVGAACSECSESDPSAAVERQAEVEDERDPASDEDAPPTDEAPPEPEEAQESRPYIDSYRGAVDAYNAREKEAYFARLSDPLSCFYGKGGVALEDVRRRRWTEDALGTLAVAQLRVLSSDEDSALLLDRGYFAGGPERKRQTAHEKLVLMKRQKDVWKIAAETNREGMGCLDDHEPSPDVLTRPESFARCKSTLSKCSAACAEASCRRECGQQALACLGLSVPRDTPPRSGGGGSATLESTDDVARFVRLAVALQHPQHYTGAEPSETDREWYWSTAESLGGPRWRTSQLGPWEQPESSCSWFIYPSNGLRGFPAAVGAVRCAGDLSRCAAWIETEEQEQVAVHLLFGDDGGDQRLVAAYSDLLDPGAPPAGDALPDLPGDAQRLREEADQPCEPMMEAVLMDRVGEEVWSSFHVLGAPDPDWPEGATATVSRHCGDEAEAEARSWSDAWQCGGLECKPWSMCGNACRSVRGVREGGEVRVLSFAEGEHGYGPLTPEQTEELRSNVACGETAYVGDFDALEIVE